MEEPIEYDINFILDSWYDRQVIKKIILKLLEEYWKITIEYTDLEIYDFKKIFKINYNNKIINIKLGDNLIFLDESLVLKCKVKDVNYAEFSIIVNPVEFYYKNSKWMIIRFAIDVDLINEAFLLVKTQKLFERYYELINPDIVTLWDYCLPMTINEIKNDIWHWDMLYLKNTFLDINKEYKNIDFLEYKSWKLFYIDKNIDIIINNLL